ncbi:MAG: hypothetical protein RL518_1776 [Pseudomonadota bacterium]|jgi:uncharacterized membrane protein
MTLLLLVALLTVVGTVIAAPLFEFVIGTLLLIPVGRFLLGWCLLQVGFDSSSGVVSALLYLLSFGAITGFAYTVFGKRAERVAKREFYPIVFFAVVFCIGYALCMRWPDFIDLGERLRDYSMLASSIDSPVAPKEPWMDGIKLNYYVYWYRFGNLLSVVLGMQTWEAYHALVAFSISLYAAVIFQIVRVILGGGVGVAAMAGLFIPFGANVAGMLCAKRSEQGYGWEPDNGWWGPSRVVQGAIDEFPAWSFVLGDAHPHFLNIAALPFFLLILYRILTSTGGVLFRFSQAGVFVVGAALFLKASNAWEVPMWLGTVACVAVLAGFFFVNRISVSGSLSANQVKPFELIKGGLGVLILLASLWAIYRYHNPESPLTSFILLAVGVGFFVISFPWAVLPTTGVPQLMKLRPHKGWVAFWVILFVTLWLSGQHIVPPDKIPAKFVRQPTQVTTTAELFMHWGIQLSFLAVGSLLLLRLSTQTVILAGFLGLSLLYDKAALFIYCVMALQVVRCIADKEKGAELPWARVFEDALIVSGLILILTPEIVFLDDSYGPEIDRMNTIFKLYTTAWGLLGLGAVSVTTRALKRYEYLVADYGKAFPIAVGGVIAVGLAYGCSKFYFHTVPMRQNGSLDPTFEAMLEGLGEANRWHKGSADAIRALRKLPKGRVLEAQGRAYSYTGFVSTLSSQPSYLGWANHINLLNKVYGDVSRRESLTKQIFNEGDCGARKELARAEKIRYIVVGTLEEKAYPGARGKDYSCFASVVQSGDYAVYQIPPSS